MTESKAKAPNNLLRCPRFHSRGHAANPQNPSPGTEAYPGGSGLTRGATSPHGERAQATKYPRTQLIYRGMSESEVGRLSKAKVEKQAEKGGAGPHHRTVSGFRTIQIKRSIVTNPVLLRGSLPALQPKHQG